MPVAGIETGDVMNCGIPWLAILATYYCYVVMVIFSYSAFYRHKFFLWLGIEKQSAPKGYAPILSDFSSLYMRFVYARISDCWNRPISSTPGAYFDLMCMEGDPYTFSLKPNGKTKRCLNLSSYNYLGFAENEGPVIEKVVETIYNHSTTVAGPRVELGTTQIHRELELLIAEFLEKEDSIVFGMGYASNSTTLPSLIGRGGLIISDSLNHASLIIGCRATGAKVKVFKHNDPEDLERVLRASIIEGQPRTRQPWTKIIILVEGIYSMEGEILRLKEIVKLKKKYNAYLYVDEAHSIGALGPTGRGVCEHAGVPTSDVDILMGTLTKSFGAAGGYISGSKKLIDWLRVTTFSSLYDTSMSQPCAQQCISSLRTIMGKDGGEDGKRRLVALKHNSNYFRRRLREEGFQLIGDDDSPIIPMMCYNPSKYALLSRVMLEHNIAVVIVGYPATPLLLGRVRFCVSAAHSEEDLESAVQTISKIGSQLLVNYLKPDGAWI